MNLTVLAQHLLLAASQAKAANLLKQQQSRNLIKLYFEDHGQFSSEIEDTLEVLRELNDWRVQIAQAGSCGTGSGLWRCNPSLRLDCSRVKAMLLGFIQAEGKAPDRTCQIVLRYKVS